MLDECRGLLAAGSYPEAESRLKSYLQSNPASTEASTLLGIVFTKTGHLNQAADCLEFALRTDPARIEAITWLAMVRKSQGRPEDVIVLLGPALELRQDDPKIFNLLGISLLSLGRAGEAEAAFRSSISLQAGSAPAYSNLGMALRLQNRGDDALESFQRALLLDPAHAQNHLQLFKQLQQMSRSDEAMEALQVGVRTHPGSILLAEALAVAYGRLKRTEEAERIFRAISQVSATAANSYATWLQEEGRFEDSVPVLQTSLRLQPLQGAAYRSLVEAKQFSLAGKPLLEMALGIVDEPDLDEAGRMHLFYALGKLYENDAKYQAAMRSFDAANAIAYRTYPSCGTFDPAWTNREPMLVSELYSKTFMEQLAQMGSPDPRPIFIVGMIRSGTTLLDRIVSSHPEVVSVGEGTFWNTEADAIHPRWMNARPSESDIESIAKTYLSAVSVGQTPGRFTDKMPLNFRHLGLIHIVFPEARILHIRRDPFDTCLSIYSTFFAGGPNFTYNQANIVTFYRAYLRYMEHWRRSLPEDRFFELDYESLVTDPAPLIREVIEFLGLRWDDACLQHEANQEQVSTPSRWQARQPIYTSSIGKRKNYGAFAGALAEL